MALGPAKILSCPSRLAPSAQRVEGGAADTRAEGESTNAEGSKNACLKRFENCLFAVYMHSPDAKVNNA